MLAEQVGNSAGCARGGQTMTHNLAMAVSRDRNFSLLGFAGEAEGKYAFAAPNNYTAYEHKTSSRKGARLC